MEDPDQYDSGPEDAMARRRSVPVIEETLDVGKRVVDGAGYRLTKQVTTHDEVVDEPLNTTRVSVERRRIDRWLPDGVVPGPKVEGDTTIYPVCEEVLVTEKRLMLREEVRVTRTQEMRRDPVTVSLRREDVVVERLDGGVKEEPATSLSPSIEDGRNPAV